MDSARIAGEAARRRTFAIIAHPDAGKTTLTEKLLLYSGAIHLAGSVKGKRASRHVSSDWMALERQRGISVTSSVLQFPYGDAECNLLDTPGHQDFGEDTYRTLFAADSAIMLLDNAKGVEIQTKKLFHVCRLRKTPIVTFINKCDREGKEPLELLSEVEQVLGIATVPVDWPIGSGRSFAGVYDRLADRVHLFSGGKRGSEVANEEVLAPNDPAIAMRIGESLYRKLIDDLELLAAAGDPLDRDRFLAGEQSPVFFGSAGTNFGVGPFLHRFVELAPSPGSRATKDGGAQAAADPAFSAFVFKIQANMDPSHRDRLVFVRVCSGRFEPGMQVRHLRLGKQIRLTAAHHVLGRDRVLVDEAYAGDVLGLVDTQHLFRIGDTLAERQSAPFLGMPRFAPEIFATLRLRDPLRRKQLLRGITQLAEEGAVQVFFRRGQGALDPIVAVVGVLQLEVLQHRLLEEYAVQVQVQRMGFAHARWLGGVTDPARAAREIVGTHVDDADGHPVVLLRNDWELGVVEAEHPTVRFLATSPLDEGGTVQAVR